jgi:predicted alpha/beta-hydrolase family hydrolase
MPTPEAFERATEPAVRGFLHLPAKACGDALVLTHGAGSNCEAPLLGALANTLADAGYLVLRCDLPYRQTRQSGPPRPGDAARDREGLANAVAVMRERVPGRVFLGGHSYGGRQSSMLVAEHAEIAAGLLLLSYPLHPPGKSQQLRVQHFPRLQVPAFFVHGTKDPFGSTEEFQSALKLIPAKTALMEVEGAGHDLEYGKKTSKQQDLPTRILEQFQRFSSVITPLA